MVDRSLCLVEIHRNHAEKRQKMAVPVSHSLYLLLIIICKYIHEQVGALGSRVHALFCQLNQGWSSAYHFCRGSPDFRVYTKTLSGPHRKRDLIKKGVISCVRTQP